MRSFLQKPFYSKAKQHITKMLSLIQKTTLQVKLKNKVFFVLKMENNGRFKYISLFQILTFSSFLIAQTGPGGVGNSSSNELWLPVEGNCYTNAGITLGINNSNIQQWNDISGNSRNASQTTASYKPRLNTNALNGFSTLNFDGSDDRILSTGLATSAQVTLFTVVKFNNFTNNNDGIIQAGPPGTAFNSTTSTKSIGMWINSATKMIWGRGVQVNNTERNITQTTALATGQFYIITQDYNGSSITQYVNGTQAGTVSYNNTLKSWSDFGIGRQSGESLNGDLSEIIVHRVSLNSVQRLITENYLAAKYGLTLSSKDIYTMDDVANGNFDHEVAGIGRINATNIHNDAKGSGIVRILNPSGLDDDEFLIWGHNNGIQHAIVQNDVPATVQARFDRVWRVSEVNTLKNAVDVGTIDIRFDLSTFSPVVASDLRLLIDNNNNGLFSDDIPISGATHLGSGIYEFKDVTTLDNTERFTIGTINIGSTPLPIELISFNANAIDNRKVKLDWQTGSEKNNDFFTLENSLNGVDWNLVAKVDGAGNSNTALNYSYMDYNPHSGISYYRIKQTDFNGDVENLAVKSVNVDQSAFENVVIYPNPTKDKITVFGKKSELANILISNTLGQDVSALTVTNTIDDSTITIDLSNLANGTYYLKTKTATTIVMKQ